MSIDQVLSSMHQREYAGGKAIYRVFNDEGAGQEEELGGEDGAVEAGLVAPEVNDQVQTVQQPKMDFTEMAKAEAKANKEANHKEIMGAMVDVFKEEGTESVLVDDLAAKLQDKGVNARVVGGENVVNAKGNEVRSGATLEITQKDGSKIVMKDSNGDGAIGMEDKQFEKIMGDYDKGSLEMISNLADNENTAN
jgi:hypothetical protein